MSNASATDVSDWLLQLAPIADDQSIMLPFSSYFQRISNIFAYIFREIRSYDKEAVYPGPDLAGGRPGAQP